MIDPLARSLWPCGPCPPGTPLGSKKFNFIMCVVGDSRTAGVGTPSGNGWRKALNQMALASGLNITWKGNQVTGDYVPAQRTQGVVGATVPDHEATGTINTPQYFGVGQPLHPCDGFLILLGTNDGMNGAADPNAIAFDTNMATLYAQLVAKEPGCTAGTAYIDRGGGATRNQGIDFINANKMAAAVAAMNAVVGGGGCALGDTRVLTQLGVAASGGNGAQYLGTEGPQWLHENDAGDILIAAALWPVVCNMAGFNAVYPGQQLT